MIFFTSSSSLEVLPPSKRGYKSGIYSANTPSPVEGFHLDCSPPRFFAEMAYPGYGAPAAGFPGMQQDPLYGYFAAVAGQDGQISPDELQRCLTQSGISGSYQPFSLETCRLMINMLDRDMSGTMGFNEFKELWQALNGWKGTFVSFDRDHSGTVEGHEMQQAIRTMGYGLSPQAMNCIMKRYSNHGRIAFDEFVSCCVRLRALTDQFRRRDTSQSGNASFQYDDFIQVTMSV